jgi:hypothetical protein
MTTITAAWLKKNWASPRQVDLFRATFGGKAEITRSNLLKLASAGFDMGWLAAKTLTPEQRQAFDDALTALRVDDAMMALRAYDDALTAMRADDAMSAVRAYDDAMSALRTPDGTLAATRASDAVKAEAYWAVSQ